MAIFLTGLNLTLVSQIRGSILGVETLASLSSTFSQALWISIATLLQFSALVTSTRGCKDVVVMAVVDRQQADVRLVYVITVVVPIIHLMIVGASLTNLFGLDMC